MDSCCGEFIVYTFMVGVLWLIMRGELEIEPLDIDVDGM